MIKLKKILETLPASYKKSAGGNASKQGVGVISTWSKMIMLVVSDTSNTFESKSKRELFLKTLKSMLKRRTDALDYDYSVIKPDEKIDNLKFYPATNKIIGIFPAYMFKKNKVSFENFVYYHDLIKLFPNLEMKEKQKIQ
jgi:hypothetical protein